MCYISPRTKPERRAWAKKELAALSVERKNTHSTTVCTRLHEYLHTYQSWAVFLPFDYEPNIFPFIQTLWNAGKIVVVPQVEKSSLQCAVYTPTSVLTQ